MNKKKLAGRIAAVSLTSVMAFGTVGLVAGCSEKTDKLVIMSEAMDGLFNPFFSTTGPDMEIVGMTQIGMLSTNSEGKLAYGEDEPTVVLDYKSEYNKDEQGTNPTKQGVTTHYFVLKNGITFSDGTPLTMNDVLFNMYVYLDPVYTGSTTMYSTDIVGLSKYRTQSSASGTGSQDDIISKRAALIAQDRVNELTDLYRETSRKLNPGSTTYEVPVDEMNKAIDAKEYFSDGYKNAISDDDNISVEDCRKQLKADYQLTLDTFKKELETDYESAKDSYKESSPYKEWDAKNPSVKFSDEIVSFMYMEGYVPITYTDNTKTTIKEVTYSYTNLTSRQAALDYVFDDKVSTALEEVLNYYATANTVRNDYVAKATELIIHENVKDGELVYDNIDGIVSMGHDSAIQDTSVSIGNNTYKIAKEYKEDGTVANADEYAVLRIKVNGVDPKAVWNFSFTVAPYHYYSNPSDEKLKMNIADNKFGVEWGKFEFMKNVIQGNNAYGVSKNQVPVGAGAYQASDSDNRDLKDVKGNTFNSNGSVYFKSNDNFLLGAPKIKNIVYQEVPSNDALNVLQKGSVHFVTPQATRENQELINSLKSKGIESKDTWQLGYGYIGVNAGKVPDINLRKAIMSAMNPSLALSYYVTGSVANISWPMSVVSWAYPRTAGGFNASKPLENMDTNTGKDYMMYNTYNGDTQKAKAEAITKIKKYMAMATPAATTGDSRLKVDFTIAGANLTEHPVYSVFENAVELLTECGWQVTLKPDNNALTKLSSGALEVWAAAWGSTNDPDMYQVYHKNSTATSVLSWGYREILGNPSTYPEENAILNELSVLIDQGRMYTDEATRTGIYKQAMLKVMDLAVEMPVYQRKELYAYNAKVIDTNTFPQEINSYSSPLGRIWEIDFVD